MNEKLQLLIEMRDKLSKPLTDQQKALRGVQQQIKELLKAQKLEEKAQQQAIKDQAKAKKSAEEWSKAVGAEMVGAAGAAATGVAVVAAGVLAFAGAIVYATAKVAEFITAQSAMGEKLAASYTLFSGAPEKTRDMIDDLAARMRVGPDKLHETAHALLAAGIKPQLELQRSVRAVTELQKTGNEGAAKKLQGLFESGAQTRRNFGGRGFVGITRQEATEVLGAGGWEQLQTAIKARGGHALRTGYNSLMTDTDTLNKALADAVTGGKIGATARNMIGGLPEVFARARAELRRFFETISHGEGFRRFVMSLHGLIDVFEAFGKQGGAKSSVGILDQGFKLLGKGIERGTILLINMVTWTYKFATAVLKAYIAIRTWLKQGDRLNTLKAALMGVALILAGVVLVVLALTVALAVMWAVLMLPLLVVVGLFALLGVAVYKVTKHFKAWKQEAIDAVASLIDGLITGITKGVTAIQDASKKLGKGVITGVKAALDIHSPSREMMKLGAMSAAGFQAGLDGHGFSIGAIQAPRISAGAGRVGSSITWNGDVIIQGGLGATRDELKPLIDSAFADAFERLQIEMGSA